MRKKLLMVSPTDIPAFILAGGLGTRLREVVCDRPKALATVNGRPFLQYLLEQLADNGISRVVLGTGYLGEQIENAFGKRHRGMEILYSREPEPLGTGGALRHALPLLDGEELLVMNGDSFCDFDYHAFRSFHREKRGSMTLCLAQEPEIARYGAVKVDQGGRITEFAEKGAVSGGGAINAGIYLLRRAVIEGIPAGRAVSLEKEIIPELIGAGLFGFRTRGRFIDIGIPGDYRAAQEFFARGPATEVARPPCEPGATTGQGEAIA